MAATPTALPSHDAPTGPPPWRELLHEGRTPLTVGLVLVELLAGLESLVVTAAMPRVAHDLDGVAFYGLVFSGYGLAGLASIPVAGREADRHGPARTFLVMAAVFGAGTLLCGIAPSMLGLAGARLVQGYGGGGVYTIAYAAVARTYPERLRPRLLSILAAVWVASAVVGPSYGSLVASTIGWRWVFFSVLPILLVAATLATPALRRAVPGGTHLTRLPLRPPLQLAAGVGVGMAALSAASWLTIPGLVAGVVLGAPALRRLLPPGTLTAAPGRAAAVVVSFFLNLGFFTADAFVPLLLTDVRGRSLAEAGLVVTVVTVGWSIGAWVQGREAGRRAPHQLVLVGGSLALLGIAAMSLLLTGLPVVIGEVLWFFGGAGMGMSFQTVLLASMGDGNSGEEGGIMAARFLAGRLGIALGTGVGGGFIALASVAHLPLRAGLGAAFAMALLSTIICLMLAPRIAAPTREG